MANLKLNTQENKEKLQNIFIEKINKVYDQCVGYEQFGNVTEFYDEDGVRLMTCSEENGKLIFSFSEDDENNSFEYDTDTLEDFD